MKQTRNTRHDSFQDSTDAMSCEELGLFVRIRKALLQGTDITVPVDIELLVELSGLTRYKLEMAWRNIEALFTQQGGFLYYGPDQPTEAM